MKNLNHITLVFQPVKAEFRITRNPVNKKTVYRQLVRQIAQYIISNGYLPTELRSSTADEIIFSLYLQPARSTEFDTPLKDL